MSKRTREFVADHAFRELCEKFRALEARKVAGEASANFEQAHLICDARVRLKVPVAVICEKLDLSRQSVNTYRNVGERIEDGLFRVLIEERRPNGLPLFPWSIIVQVARLANPAERQELIENIRLRGWRTRDVEGYVSVQRSEASARGHTKGAVEAKGTPLVSDRLTNRIEMFVKDAARNAPPTRILIAVADAASRTIRDAAEDAACGRAPARELDAARDALTRCAAAVADAWNAVTKRMAEAEAQQSRSRVSGVIRCVDSGGNGPSLSNPPDIP